MVHYGPTGAVITTNPGPTPTNLLFDCDTCEELDRKHFLRLSAGVCGAVKVRNFFHRGECATIMKNLETCTMGSYDEQLVRPRIPKLGPAAFDYYQTGGLNRSYWEHAAQSSAVRSSLLNDADPLGRAMSRIAKAWGSSVRPLTSNGHPMFAGMIREMTNGAGIHFDELVREFPGAPDEIPVAQLAFNCHLTMPEAGGELHIFRRRWKPEDEPSRGDSYWYPEDIFLGDRYISVLAEIGDAVFFDPRNYHRILPRRGKGRRVTFSFFLGLSGSGDLLVWS
jgi:L-gamma-glutamyl-L-propargylglycine hydroxylase